MKKIMYLFFFGTSYFGFSQTQELLSLQESNPSIIIINAVDLPTFSQEQLDKMSKDVIVVNRDGTFYPLLESSDPSKKEPAMTQLVKDWLGLHQDILIIPRSKYNIATDNDKENWLLAKAMILMAEEVSNQDIYNYPY